MIEVTSGFGIGFTFGWLLGMFIVFLTDTINKNKEKNERFNH